MEGLQYELVRSVHHPNPLDGKMRQHVICRLPESAGM